MWKKIAQSSIQNPQSSRRKDHLVFESTSPVMLLKSLIFIHVLCQWCFFVDYAGSYLDTNSTHWYILWVSKDIYREGLLPSVTWQHFNSFKITIMPPAFKASVLSGLNILSFLNHPFLSKSSSFNMTWGSFLHPWWTSKTLKHQPWTIHLRLYVSVGSKINNFSLFLCQPRIHQGNY